MTTKKGDQAPLMVPLGTPLATLGEVIRLKEQTGMAERNNNSEKTGNPSTTKNKKETNIMAHTQRVTPAVRNRIHELVPDENMRKTIENDVEQFAEQLVKDAQNEAWASYAKKHAVPQPPTVLDDPSPLKRTSKVVVHYAAIGMGLSIGVLIVAGVSSLVLYLGEKLIGYFTGGGEVHAMAEAA